MRRWGRASCTEGMAPANPWRADTRGGGGNPEAPRLAGRCLRFWKGSRADLEGLEGHVKDGLYSASQGEPLEIYKPGGDRVIHSL